MGLMIGSARIDERGKLTGGAMGDQTGNEVSMQTYYLHKKGWYVIRATDISVANAIADAMIQACENNYIGYCQGHRTTVITMLKRYGSLAKIVENTEADCSSLVRACCIQAGFDPGNFNTSTEVTALAKTKKFMKKIQVTSSTVLYNGDILVTKTKGHTAVVVSGNPRKAASTGSQNTSTGTTTTKVDAATRRDGSLAGTYTTTSDLHLRSGAGTGKKSLAVMAKGSKVTCYGYYNLDRDGIKWLYVTYKNGKETRTGYASSRYLKK